MSDKKSYSGPLMGWVNDPIPSKYDENSFSVSFRLKKGELKEIWEKYVTPLNEKGEGENAWFTIWQQKSGRWGLQVFDPNSESAQEARASRNKTSYKPKPVSTPVADNEDDLPF